MIRSILGKVILLVLVLLIVWQHRLILYGIAQAKGQLQIIYASREIAEVLQDPAIADSIKYKLQMIGEVKRFVVDSLGFTESRNYTTYYNQHGKPILWVVTAARPYAMEPKEWHFPFLGKVPYKGFFVYTKAQEEEEQLAGNDWDTNLRVAGGWSTLGWFRDPVLSNMLNEGVGDLVNTIIHELTHGELFVKDSVEFNENLASFFGDQGARQFLISKFGSGSQPYQDYLKTHSDRKKFTDHILRGAYLLDSLYQTQAQTLDENLRYSSKKGLIDEIIFTSDTLDLYEKQRFTLFLKESKVNNAFFMSYLRYRADFTFFEAELMDKFNGNLKDYFRHFKREYPSL